MKPAAHPMEVTADPIYPAALTIAGSDSGGGAGIEADLRTFSAFGVYGCAAITALTAQNPLGVNGIAPTEPDFVRAQIQAVFQEFQIRAVKTGMLFSSGIIHTVAESLREFYGGIVVDPVMIATSGARLLQPDAVETLLGELLPLASWITPNLPETEVISGMTIKSQKDMIQAGRLCANRFHCGVIVKGGHAIGPDAEDIVLTGPDAEPFSLKTERLALDPTAPHGTGCTFSSALAANLAKGVVPEQAVRNAKQFVFESLQNAVHPGPRIYGMFPKGFRA